MFRYALIAIVCKSEVLSIGVTHLHYPFTHTMVPPYLLSHMQFVLWFDERGHEYEEGVKVFGS